MNAPLDVDETPEIDPKIPAPAPLRRPRSPPREQPMQRDEDSGSDRGAKKFVSPGNNSVLKSAQRNRPLNRPNYQDKPNHFDKPNSQSDRPNSQSDRSNNQSDRPNIQYDKPNRQSDNANKQSDRSNRQSDRSNNRQSQDGGRAPLRRPQATNGESIPGQSNRNGQHVRKRPQNQAQYNNSHQDDEDWDSPSYHNRQQNHQNKHQQSSSSWLDRKRQLSGSQFTNNDEEDWGASKPEKMAQAKEESKPAPVKETPIVQANRVQSLSSPSNQREAPATNQNAVKPAAAHVKPPASAADSTPARKLVPKTSLIELLSKGDVVVLSVDRPASECHTNATGFVCTSLHENFSADYEALCDAYGTACEAEAPYTPAPGETFSYFDRSDEGWYRARCLTPQHCALLDASKVVPLADARTVRLPAKFEQIPEFTTLLQASVKVADNLRCTLLEKTAIGWTVEIEDAADGKRIGEGEVSRWLPTVQYPPAPTPAPTSAAIPEVSRPDVANNSTMLMVHVTDVSNIYVRPGEPDQIRAFDGVLHDVAVFGLNATPLSAPPTAGSYVVSKYTDGVPYRALVKRTNVQKNKYLIEYIEFGNSHINQLENLYPLPENLHPKNVAPMTSRVALAMTSQHPLTPPAEQYLDSLKEGEVPLVLTIPSGAKSAPNGAEVTLTVASKNENVNRKVQELCTPDWEKLQQRGGDVIETEHLMNDTLKFLPLPTPPCTLVVTDVSSLIGGMLSVAPNMPDMHDKLANITGRMAKYCESEIGREPYLPKIEELCIAQMPPYKQWFRAVFAEHKVGETEASVCYIDYGNIDRVPVSLVRKMLPEFMRDLPAIASTVEIKDFPKNLTNEMLQRALAYLNLDDQDRGSIAITSCKKDDGMEGFYIVEAPELLKAMRG